MTREEKISRLKDILSEINENDNAVCYLTSEDNELIESVIKALEQEPKFIAKSDGTIEQIKNCNDCLFKNEWEKIGKFISVALEKQTEQEPKTGHWISYWDEEARCHVYKCPECGNKQPFDTKHCWECGTRLIEPQESEET